MPNTPPSWLSNVGILILAGAVVGFVGAYALLYPGTALGQSAIGALIFGAGTILNHYFASQERSFLGQQLNAQRTAFVASMAPVAAVAATSPSTPSASSPSSSESISSASTPASSGS